MLRRFGALGAVKRRGGLATMFSGGRTGVWYDPSDLSTLRQNSDGTGAVAVGDPVGYMADKSGGGHHVIQATAANRPTLQYENGTYYLLFDGVNDMLIRTAGITFTTPFDRISAVRADTWVAVRTMIANGSSTLGGTLYQQGASPNISMYLGLPFHNTTFTLGVGQVVAERYNGASSQLAVGNGAYVTGNSGAGTSIVGVCIGARPDATNHMPFRFYGTLARDVVFSDAEIATIRAHMTAAITPRISTDPSASLVWTSDGSDTTPEFSIAFANTQESDVLETETRRVGEATPVSTSNGGAIFGSSGTLTLPSLTADDYEIRARIVREYGLAGETAYAWSSWLPFTITASPASYTHLATQAEDTYPQTTHTMPITLGAVGSHDILVAVSCGNGKPVPTVSIGGQALTFQRRAGADATGGSIAWFRGTVTAIGGAQVITTTWSSADWDYKSTSAWELFNAPAGFKTHDNGAYVNNNPDGNGSFVISGLASGDMVFAAATMAGGPSATFATGSTPEPNGQRRSVDGATGLMWSGDWLMASAGTLTFESPDSNAIRSYMVVGV